MTSRVRGQYSLLVSAVQDAYKMRGNNYIHLITFIDTDGEYYQAENFEAFSKSMFVLNKKNIFEVTNPGRPGTLDWIRFVGVDNEDTCCGNSKVEATREDLIIAQTALNNAVQLGIKYNWTKDEIVENAYFFAGNIKSIAHRIAEDFKKPVNGTNKSGNS